MVPHELVQPLPPTTRLETWNFDPRLVWDQEDLVVVGKGVTLENMHGTSESSLHLPLPPSAAGSDFDGVHMHISAVG